MSEPFLILHKVRGEPAFDIAEKITIGDEEGWIISTSGHRAYPCWIVSIAQLPVCLYNNPNALTEATSYPMPGDWPDHYSPKPEPLQPTLSSLLDQLGLLPKIRRRV